MRLRGGEKMEVGRRKKRQCVISLIPAGALICVPSAKSPVQDQIRVHFIDVGQGDATYIQLPDHYDILIDAGDAEHGDDVVRYLRAKGMDGDLELLIATHPHEDHIGGLPEVMAAFEVDKVIDSGVAVQSECYESYRQAAEAERCT